MAKGPSRGTAVLEVEVEAEHPSDAIGALERPQARHWNAVDRNIGELRDQPRIFKIRIETQYVDLMPVLAKPPRETEDKCFRPAKDQRFSD